MKAAVLVARDPFRFVRFLARAVLLVFLEIPALAAGAFGVGEDLRVGVGGFHDVAGVGDRFGLPAGGVGLGGAGGFAVAGHFARRERRASHGGDNVGWNAAH